MRHVLVLVVLLPFCLTMPNDIAKLFGLRPNVLAGNICDLGPCINNACPAAKGVQYWCCPYNWECCRNIPMIEATSELCVDKANFVTGKSDCTDRKQLCNDPNYETFMRTECPKTCGFCN